MKDQEKLKNIIIIQQLEGLKKEDEQINEWLYIYIYISEVERIKFRFLQKTCVFIFSKISQNTQ